MDTHIPSDTLLKETLISLKSTNPTLGISKIHGLCLAQNPGWSVSEKRVRRVLVAEGLVNSSGAGAGATSASASAGSGTATGAAGTAADLVNGAASAPAYPTSHLIPNLDVSKWTTKVSVKYFDKQKGKGLVAKEVIKEGEVIWKEDPFVCAPEWQVYDAQIQSKVCGYCTTPLNSITSSLPCPSSSPNSDPKSVQFCPIRYCNRLCLLRSQSSKPGQGQGTHPLLCPAQNPASVPLLKYARKTEWMGLHAWAACVGRVLLGYQNEHQEKKDKVKNGKGEGKGCEDDWRFVKSLAVLSTLPIPPSQEQTYEKGYLLFLQAFGIVGSAYAPDHNQKKLASLLKKPITTEMVEEFFGRKGFMRGVGRMKLNLEAHGGLYTLHSHLNHSCSPNTSIRHLSQNTSRSRITVLALKDIQEGEELVISYVDPSLGWRERGRELEAWGFVNTNANGGGCGCVRCVEERRGESERQNVNGNGDGKREEKGLDMGDLERELKAGLGVL